MQIKYNVLDKFLLINCEIEPNIDGFHGEPLIISKAGFEELRVINKPGWSDEHESKLLTSPIVRIFHHIDIARYSSFLRSIVNGL